MATNAIQHRATVGDTLVASRPHPASRRAVGLGQDKPVPYDGVAPPRDSSSDAEPRWTCNLEKDREEVFACLELQDDDVELFAYAPLRFLLHGFQRSLTQSSDIRHYFRPCAMAMIAFPMTRKERTARGHRTFGGEPPELAVGTPAPERDVQRAGRESCRPGLDRRRRRLRLG